MNQVSEKDLDNRLYEVLYMMRNWCEGDDEQTRIYNVGTDPKTGAVIYDGMEYLGTLPDRIRDAAVAIVEEFSDYDGAIKIFCVYWLKYDNWRGLMRLFRESDEDRKSELEFLEEAWEAALKEFNV